MQLKLLRCAALIWAAVCVLAGGGGAEAGRCRAPELKPRTEAPWALLRLKNGVIPANVNLHALDESVEQFGVELVKENVSLPSNERRLALKNSFGFGGTNVSLLFSTFH